MLSIPTEFPMAGSIGYTVGAVEQVRIIGRDDYNICQITIIDRRFQSEKASSNRSVPLSQLRETPEEAALVNKPCHHHSAARYSLRNTV